MIARNCGRRSRGGDGLGVAGRAWWLWAWLCGWVEAKIDDKNK